MTISQIILLSASTACLVGTLIHITSVRLLRRHARKASQDAEVWLTAKLHGALEEELEHFLDWLYDEDDRPEKVDKLKDTEMNKVIIDQYMMYRLNNKPTRA